MRAIQPNIRRRPLWRTVLLAALAITVGGAGTIAVLAGLKVIDPAKLAFWRNKATHPAGWVGIPLSARLIPAYTEVTRDYLMNLKTGALELKWVAPDAIPKGIVADLSKILGRVTAHEKQAVYFFKESDFLPAGTHPGVVGGTPHGKRAFTLEADKLKGCVHELKEGDHVDLLVSIPVDMPGASRSNSGPLGASVMATPDTLLLPKRSLVKPLVQDGVVVSPVTARMVPTTNSSLMNGTTTRNTRVQEIVLAVAPDEVAPLGEAMDLKYQITCVARSGRPASVPSPAAQRPAGGTSQGGMSQFLAALGNAFLGKDNTAAPPPGRAKTVNPTKSETLAGDRASMDITPGLNPMAEVRFMEVMIGTKRQFVLFNGPGNSPVVTSEADGSARAAPGAGSAGAVEESE
ncbi:MAG: hypothetical protein ACLQNE_11580 [Thermoguttaceae bacterium]